MPTKSILKDSCHFLQQDLLHFINFKRVKSIKNKKKLFELKKFSKWRIENVLPEILQILNLRKPLVNIKLFWIEIFLNELSKSHFHEYHSSTTFKSAFENVHIFINLSHPIFYSPHKISYMRQLHNNE